MMKIVQRVAKWSTAVAVALSLSGSAKAATLAEIVSTLGQTYTLTQLSPTEAKQAFITTGPVGLYVIESNQNTSFGFERNGTNNVISVQKGFTSGDKKGFDVFGGVAGPNPLTVITNPTATVFSQDSTSNAADTGIVGSKKLDATSVIGNGPFHFTLRLSPGFSGPNNDGGPSNTLSNLGQSTVLNTGSNTPYGTFTQYKISGDSESKYNDSYLIAYTYNEDSANGYTFAAIVSGVVNPEPASIAMLATGVFGLIGYRARRRRQSAEAIQVV